jgi:hypothetical protein
MKAIPTDDIPICDVMYMLYSVPSPIFGYLPPSIIEGVMSETRELKTSFLTVKTIRHDSL